jgi:L-histidine N-alpha-methyltransferase
MSSLNSSAVRPFVSAAKQPTIQQDRLTLDYLLSTTSSEASTDSADVIAGLTSHPKSLPPKYFYDDRGSQLFEQITQLPEYYLTRTETQILNRYANAIAEKIGPCELVELGSGSSTKTRYLLNAMVRLGYSPHYVPVDVSGGMLEVTAQQLLSEYDTLTVHGLVGTYGLALQHLPQPKLPARMIMFIGSTLGNLEPQSCHHLLDKISTVLNPGDYFLLGVDLEKSSDILHRAYNDSQGITAAFNLNMLHHLNWRFQGNFQVEQFQHRALYNADASQIEIYIDSLVTQQVMLKALGLDILFEQGESLRSEISRKFKIESLATEMATVGMNLVQAFTDDQRWFGLLLFQK